MYYIHWLSPVMCLVEITGVWAIVILVKSMENTEHTSLSVWCLCYLFNIFLFMLLPCASAKLWRLVTIYTILNLLALPLVWIQGKSWPLYQFIFGCAVSGSMDFSLVYFLCYLYVCRTLNTTRTLRRQYPIHVFVNVIPRSEKEWEPEMCSICQEETDRHPVVWSGCQHMFHPTCINRWIAFGNTCPNCRTEATSMNQV